MIIKKKIRSLDLSATLKINEISKNLQNKGKKIIKFGFGQSPFQVPKLIVEELKKNAHRKNYLPIQGLEELRDAIAVYESKKKSTKFDKDQIIIGPGSKELIFLLHLCFDGDIILPSPSWVSYMPQSIIADNKFHWIETKPEDNWFPNNHEIKKIVNKNKSKKYLLILNSPNNPSGQVCKNLEKLSEIIKEENIYVLSDEIYSELTFDEDYISLTKYCPQNVIVSNGLSKWCGAGGWRLGYFIVPKNLNNLLDSIKILASETFSAVSAPIQYAAVSAFRNSHDIYIKRSKKILKAIGNYAYHHLISNNVIMNKPMGGFYLMPEFLNKKFNSSSEMCTDLLEKELVATLPGSEFGFDKKKMIARLSYTDFDGANFMNNLKEDSTIDDKMIEIYAPKVVEGVKKIKSWADN